MAMVTLRNDFHGTECTMRCETSWGTWNEYSISPSVAQIRRAKKELCGIAGCTCSSDAGNRGPQTHNGKRLTIELCEMFKATR